MAYLTQTLPAFPSLSDRFAALRAQIDDMIARRKLYNSTFDELDSLTDRELADVGISRSVIAVIAREAAYGK